jgi:tRNA modification GTPase
LLATTADARLFNIGNRHSTLRQNMHRQSTASAITAALLTPAGRGAVAVIRVHCSEPTESDRAASVVEASFVAISGKPLSQQPVGRLCYGHWVADQSSEDVVVCRTNESSVEVSCHGGRAAVNRILETLATAGASIVDWQTQQANISSPFERELADALAKATTARTAAILLEQSAGRLSNELEQLLMLGPDALTGQLADLLRWSDFGLHLTQPWRVVIAGRPNVGKSTLINTLLGYTRAIVFDQPGTTRDVVTGGTAFEGWPFQLADTAGIRITDDELEQAGIKRARSTVESADLLCLLLDTSQPSTPADRELLDEFTSSTDQRNKRPPIVVAHKADLPSQWNSPLPKNTLQVSSTTRAGVEELIAAIVRTLIPTAPESGMAIPISQRQIQWLRQAHHATKAGDATQAAVSIEHCLSGETFRRRQGCDSIAAANPEPQSSDIRSSTQRRQ